MREELSGRIEATNERIDGLGKRQNDMEVRLATELIAVAGAVRDLTWQTTSHGSRPSSAGPARY